MKKYLLLTATHDGGCDRNGRCGEAWDWIEASSMIEALRKVMPKYVDGELVDGYDLMCGISECQIIEPAQSLDIDTDNIEPPVPTEVASKEHRRKLYEVLKQEFERGHQENEVSSS